MENLQDQIEQAKGLERAQKTDAALDIFLSLTQKPGPHTEDPAFWLHLGDVGHRARRAEVASDAYPRAIDLLQRTHHGNSALAVARRLARATPDSAEAHVRLADLAASLGYAGDARDAALRAAELAADGAQRESAVQSLRAAWTVLTRDGLDKDAERVRARVMEIRPDADPLGDANLVAPARPAPTSDDLGLETGTELTGAPPEPGLQPTSMADADVGASLDRLEGLEPTSAGADLGRPAGDQETVARTGQEPELPGHPDLPLLGGEPEVTGAATPAPRVPEPEATAPPARVGSDAVDRKAADEAEPPAAAEADTDDLPVLDIGAESVGVGQAPAGAAGGDHAPVVPPAPAPTPPAPPAAKPRPSPEAAPREAARPEPQPETKRAKPAEPRPEPAPAKPQRRSRPEPEPAAGAGDDYVDLGALVMSDEDEEEDGTRFQMDAAQHPSGDEDRDFAEILGMFRQKVSENIHPQDSSSHYDLGLAFKEMGLFDDAIAQLQHALRAGSNPVATLEVLGECFIEKGEHSLAVRVLSRAVRIPEATESDLVGVLYWLGRTEEVLERPDEARGFYERVIAVDIGFRDAADRLESLRGGSTSSR